MTDTPTYFTERVAFTDPAEEADAITLAQARVQMAAEGGLPYPSWKELTDHERTNAVLDARNWLRAARNAGLLQPRSDEDDELQIRINDLDASLLRTQQELAHAYADYNRLEHEQGAEQLALRHALRIPPGEVLTMTRLIRRVRQVVGDLDESRRKAAAASGRVVDLAGRMNQARQASGEIGRLYGQIKASSSGHGPLDDAPSRHALTDEPEALEPERPATNGELVTALDTMVAASVAGDPRD